MICRGASTFKGWADESPRAPGHYQFFAVMDTESDLRSDRTAFQDPSFEAMTLPMTGPAASKSPRYSLEQPCMGYAFGRSPGTTTLTYHVGGFGDLQSSIKYGSHARPRKMKLMAILERLLDLELAPLDDEHPDDTYHFLYGTLLEDPDAFKAPHYDRALQIADLITVLSNSGEWIDFSHPRNQVVAKFFDAADERVKQRFFHQLLLAMELHLRIQSREHTEEAKCELLAKLPPKVSWDLALAQRWLENMSISRGETNEAQSTFTFELQSKGRQKDALKRFAELLKWPNMDEIEYVLREDDPAEKPLEDRSADAMAWFTGVVLPGPTLPFLVMNTLIDSDRDTGEALQYLSHVHPHAGFQYRANTYWSTSSILGKVLGAGRGVKSVAGWVGPCIYTPDLDRTRCVLLRQSEPKARRRLSVRDVESMAARSDPLGSRPTDGSYAVAEFEEWLPYSYYSGGSDDAAYPPIDIIRVEKLALHEAPNGTSPFFNPKTGRGARLYDATLIFAIAGESHHVRLRYNVSFVSAFPCRGGPHPLSWDYKFLVASTEDGLDTAHVQSWLRRNNAAIAAAAAGTPAETRLISRSTPASPRRPRPRSSSTSSSRASGASHRHYSDESPRPAAENGLSGELEEVLIVEAYGVSDNEVYARSWCAYRGLDALVANVKETCVGCAVREAYAAGLGVVILTEGGAVGEVEVEGEGEDDGDSLGYGV